MNTAFSNDGYSASHRGKADIFSIIGSPESVYTNLLFYPINKKSISLSFQNHNLIPELNEKNIAFYFSENKIKVTGGLHLLNLVRYSDQLYFTNFAYQINSKFGAGIGVGYRHKHIVGYTKVNLFQTHLMFRYSPSDKIDFGLTALLYQEEQNKNYLQFSIGMRNIWSKYFTTFVEYNQNPIVANTLKFAIESKIEEYLKFSAGFILGFSQYFVGSSFVANKISVGVSISFHDVLPMSPGITATYFW